MSERSFTRTQKTRLLRSFVTLKLLQSLICPLLVTSPDEFILLESFYGFKCRRCSCGSGPLRTFYCGAFARPGNSLLDIRPANVYLARADATRYVVEIRWFRLQYLGSGEGLHAREVLPAESDSVRPCQDSGGYRNLYFLWS